MQLPGSRDMSRYWEAGLRTGGQLLGAGVHSRVVEGWGGLDSRGAMEGYRGGWLSTEGEIVGKKEDLPGSGSNRRVREGNYRRR